MFFYTKTECEEWAAFMGFDLNRIQNGGPVAESQSGLIHVLFEDEPLGRSYSLAKLFVSWLGQFQSCMLWVTEYGIWPSSENLHLYYRVRSSYGDNREHHKVPGHRFLGHEVADLVTFVDLALRFGWGGYLLTAQNWSNLFLSHDGFLRIDSTDARDKILGEIESFGLAHKIE